MEISKESYRKQVWDYLEKHDLAQFPRPVHGRIPNFKGSQSASSRLAELEPFKKAVTVKICPDKPQEHARILALQARKTVLMPIPRLREGLFQRLQLIGSVSYDRIKYAASARGAKELGQPVGLDAVLKVELVVLGSVAVSKEGYRIGKGEGFADLEYAILTEMGAISDEVLVVTTVHDCQVFEELPITIFKEHDAPVDVIVTPTQVIYVAKRLPKPKGIIWNLLTAKQLRDMPILQHLRRKQIAMGRECHLKGEAVTVERNVKPSTSSVPVNETSQNKKKYNRVQNAFSQEKCSIVRVSNIAPLVRVRDLKTALSSRGIRPAHITWYGPSGYALLHIPNTQSSQSSVAALLRNLRLGDNELSVEEFSENQ